MNTAAAVKHLLVGVTIVAVLGASLVVLNAWRLSQDLPVVSQITESPQLSCMGYAALDDRCSRYVTEAFRQEAPPEYFIRKPPKGSDLVALEDSVIWWLPGDPSDCTALLENPTEEFAYYRVPVYLATIDQSRIEIHLRLWALGHGVIARLDTASSQIQKEYDVSVLGLAGECFDSDDGVTLMLSVVLLVRHENGHYEEHVGDVAYVPLSSVVAPKQPVSPSKDSIRNETANGGVEESDTDS